MNTGKLNLQLIYSHGYIAANESKRSYNFIHFKIGFISLVLVRVIILQSQVLTFYTQQLYLSENIEIYW